MKLQNLTILITGGAGFIGSHLTESLSKENRVIVYDNYSSSVVPKRDIVGDILDEKKLSKSMVGVDVVFHLAVACVRLSLGNPRYVHDVNATGTLNMLLAAKKAQVKRFVYISSSEVYGSAKEEKINETHPIDPTTVYGMSKYMGEEYTRLFSTQIPIVIIRPFNTYGPRSHFDGVYGEVIPRFGVLALNKKQPTIFGTGKQSRDFTYITDTVDGIVRAASSDTLLGDVVNIAYGKEVSIVDIAKEVSNSARILYKPLFRPARPHDVMRHAADIKKAKKILGFAPKVSISQGIEQYIGWLKKTYPNPKKLLSLVPDTNW